MNLHFNDEDDFLDEEANDRLIYNLYLAAAKQI